jgi:hypothetical protein
MSISNKPSDDLGISAEIEERYCIIGGWPHIIGRISGLPRTSQEAFSKCPALPTCADGDRYRSWPGANLEYICVRQV